MADEQIKDARGDEETPDLDMFACLPKHIREQQESGYTGPLVEPVIGTPFESPTQDGAGWPEFVALRTAARSAHVAQQSMTITSTALREAFGAFCKAVTE